MLILTLIRPLGGVEVLCHESLFSAPTLKETAGEAHLGPFPGFGPPGSSQGFPWAGVLAPRPSLGNLVHAAVLASGLRSTCLQSCKSLELKWSFKEMGF